ncbi:hypothetical protein H6G93_05300 [Nostoc sp. FACHB-973]|uniref:Uncharacterized protein n=1 Tax=Desmonostoc muscorum LEGE 12446 TaxID=1828758 RepID=A0A8J7A8T4_DESMC|nr:hypothetical protein [Desmonostoc muscorum]MBD2514429.1 hypothetical protein [Nostoc sp. FACHB-973]MBX9258192.1 hypothetical protein [Desmonostoc muscorum CCALA 125]MCF2150278.1 hypothetical protein [Desmonostoc muscorum LEGE 12446]
MFTTSSAGKPLLKSQVTLCVKQLNCLREAAACLGSSTEKINVERPEMLCKSIIGLSSEYPCDIPNMATASDTGSLYCTEATV